MSFPSCFRPSKTSDDHHNHRPPPPPSPPPPPLSAATLTTYTYYTDAGTVSLTWSRSILGRSLHLHHHHHPFNSSTFHLRIKPFPFLFNNKRGSKTLSHNTRIFWNLSKARFGSGPEPQSNYFLALTVDNSLALLVGDASLKDACATCKARDTKNRQILVTKKEHVDVVGKRVYLTRARFGGRTRELEVEYYGDDDREENSRLLFRFDGERVLEVKRLKWKFRGNERVEVGDGAHVRITWDVHNWMFQKEPHNNNINYYYSNNNVGNVGGDGHAVFMFKFEEDEVVGVLGSGKGRGEEGGLVEQNWNDLGSWEWGKTGKSWSSSSFSMSSSAGSFGGSSSVMEWSSVEESELVVPVGFTLLVHAWRR